MYSRLITLVAFLLMSQISLTQELPDISTHSPDVANLGKYGEYPVDVSTGVPSINIPLYNITSGALKLPISISYHASGIRVDQESSSIGLGWSLNAGGVITRAIRDGSDDTNGNPNDFIHKGNNLPHYNSVDTDIAVQAAGSTGNDTNLQGYYNADTEPDLYSISANGMSGQFCLDNTLQYKSIGYEPYKYDVNLSNKTIVITNEHGVVYRFGKSLDNEEAFELTTDTYTTVDSTVDPEPLPQNNMPYNSSFHLTEIISANKTDTIKFKYKTYRYNNNRVTSFTRYTLNEGPLQPIDAIGRNFEGISKSVAATSILNIRILDKILFKNGSVEFNLVQDRLDVYQGGAPQYNIPRVASFTVFDKNQQQIKKVVFDNDAHFNRTGVGSNMLSGPISNYKKKSLKLDGVEFYDKTNAFVNDYKFEYNTTPLPPINTSSQDFWGFYNGQANTTLIPETFYTIAVSGKPTYIGENRESNATYLKAGVLNKIIYPTKGYTEYEFEPHYYLTPEQAQGKKLSQKTRTIAACNRLSSCPTGYFDGIPANNTQTFTVNEDLSNGGVDVGKLTITFSDYITTGGQSMYFRLTNQTNSTVYYFEHVPAEKSQIKVVDYDVEVREGHTYKFEAYTNGVTGSNTSLCNSPNIVASLVYDHWQTASNSQINPKQAGGLRVKSITSFDSDDTTLTKKKYVYGDTEYGSNSVGVGTLISEQSNNFYIKPRLYAVLSSSQELKDLLWFTSNTQSGLGLNNGSPVDYDMVTEYTLSLNNNNITNGKTEYYYDATGRDVDPKASVYYPYEAYTYPKWDGSRLSETIYYKQKSNLTYEKIKSEKYDYTTLPEQRIKNLKIIEVEPDLWSGFNNGGGWMFLDNNSNRFYHYNYYQSVGRKVLTKKTVKNYEGGVEKMLSSTNYFYDNTDHMQQTRVEVTDSKGDVLKTKTEYPQDLSSPTSSESNLITRHQLTVPIKTETFKKEDSYPEEKVSSQYTVFDHTIWTNQNLPRYVKSAKGSGTLENRIEYNDYDDEGRIQEVSKIDGPHIVYLWGYNEEYPIAKIENATFSQVESAIATLPSSYNTLIEIQARSNLDNDRTIGSLGKEGDLRTALDDLRDALPNAMVTTYTFDPLIGVTSITDPKGYTTYYEYDDANRLEQVKDADGNILSKNEYHYKSQ